SPCYRDDAPTPPAAPRVVAAMLPYLTGAWGNPSSIYAEAREARKGLDAARRTIAEHLGEKLNEIAFHSAGTQADNLALGGVLAAVRGRAINDQRPSTAATPAHVI